MILVERQGEGVQLLEVGPQRSVWSALWGVLVDFCFEAFAKVSAGCFEDFVKVLAGCFGASSGTQAESLDSLEEKIEEVALVSLVVV